MLGENKMSEFVAHKISGFRVLEKGKKTQLCRGIGGWQDRCLML